MVEEVGGGGEAAALIRLPRVGHSSSSSSSSGGGPIQRGDCPYEPLASYVLSAWSRKTGLPARAHKWALESDASWLTLYLGAENRWCAHIQRPHRSNGTLLRINLLEHAFAQYCFDGECKMNGFRGSDWLPVPSELCEAVIGVRSSKAVVVVRRRRTRSGTRP